MPMRAIGPLRRLALFACVLANCAHGSSPVFTSISPTTVSAFGGNILTITGSNFPSLSPNAEIICLWQGALSLPGVYKSTTEVRCPVPSVFKFVRFSGTATYQLDSLNVSFSAQALPTHAVITQQSLLGFQSRLVADELSPFTVSPRQTFESYSGMTVSIVGSGFVTGLPPGESLCRFTLISNGGRYGASVTVNATVINSTHIECMVPLLTEIDATKSAPSETVVQLSFDGGQTYSTSQTGFAYVRDFVATDIMPHQIVSTGGVNMTLVGSGFSTSPNLVCRFESDDLSFNANATYFMSSSLILCELPVLADPILGVGSYNVSLSVDGVNFIDTHQSFVMSATPASGTLTPARGYYYGGTLITITGEDFIDSPETKCIFGLVPTLLITYYNSSTVTCRAPACASAMGWTAAPETCFGLVYVTITAGDTSLGAASGFSYEYVAIQKIHSFDPWFGSGWDAPFPVRIFGQGFITSVYCQWLDLPSAPALAYGPFNSSDIEIDSYMDCVAPVLPESYRPSSATGIDYLLGYVEVSCNDVDFTVDRRQWYFYQPASITSLSPSQVWRGSTRTGGVYIKGSNFRGVNTAALACLWYYDDSQPTLVETAPAVFVDRTTLWCSPTEAVAAGAATVRVEVQMTPLVVSDSGQFLTTTIKPVVISVSVLTGPYLGGTTVVVNGTNIYQPGTDMYVVIGDSPALAIQGVDTYNSGYQLATITVPPIPHWVSTPATFDITLAVDSQDRLVADAFQFTYVSVSAGTWYRASILDGFAVQCEPGFFCGGGYPQNDTAAATSMVAPQPCPPGSFQTGPGTSGCFTCPSPAYCPKAALQAPQNCFTTDSGRVCWNRDGNDANTTFVCPLGQICLLPESLARPSELLPPVDPFAVGGGRRLTEYTVEMEDCPAGRVCGDSSVGILLTNGSIYLPPWTGVPYCSLPGIYCSPGSASPIALDHPAFPGYYVSADGSIMVPCPPGFYCQGGFLRPCPPGTYQLIYGSGVCIPCTAGTMCPTSTQTLPTICPAGRVCSLPGRVQPAYLCPAGSYCLTGVFSMDPTANVDTQFKPTIGALGTFQYLLVVLHPLSHRHLLSPRHVGSGPRPHQSLSSSPLRRGVLLRARGDQLPRPRPVSDWLLLCCGLFESGGCSSRVLRRDHGRLCAHCMQSGVLPGLGGCGFLQAVPGGLRVSH